MNSQTSCTINIVLQTLTSASRLASATMAPVAISMETTSVTATPALRVLTVYKVSTMGKLNRPLNGEYSIGLKSHI